MNDLSLDVRICKECKTTVFSKKDFAVDVAQRPPDMRAYSVGLPSLLFFNLIYLNLTTITPQSLSFNSNKAFLP